MKNKHVGGDVLADLEQWCSNPEVCKKIESYKMSKSIVYKIIREFVVTRKILGLSQRDVAKICKVKQPDIARFESFDHLNPTIDFLVKLFDALGVRLKIEFEKA